MKIQEEVVKYRQQYQEKLKHYRNMKAQKQLQEQKKDGELYDEMLQKRFLNYFMQQRQKQ